MISSTFSNLINKLKAHKCGRVIHSVVFSILIPIIHIFIPTPDQYNKRLFSFYLNVEFPSVRFLSKRERESRLPPLLDDNEIFVLLIRPLLSPGLLRRICTFRERNLNEAVGNRFFSFKINYYSV